MRIAILSCLAILVASSAAAGEREGLSGPVDAEVLRVIDDDTLEVRATIWLGQTVDTSVRVAGIDAPEMKGHCSGEREEALRARDRLALLVESGEVRLTGIRKDKYGGRVIAHVASRDGDVGDALLKQGLARAYQGHARGTWCQVADRS